MGDFDDQHKWTCKSSDYPSISITASKSVKGFTSELSIINELSKKGYWVAKSIDPQCPFDLVAVSPDGDIRLLDIKTNTYRKHEKSYRRKIWRTPTAKQKKLGIKIIMVDHANK